MSLFISTIPSEKNPCPNDRDDDYGLGAVTIYICVMSSIERRDCIQQKFWYQWHLIFSFTLHHESIPSNFVVHVPIVMQTVFRGVTVDIMCSKVQVHAWHNREVAPIEKAKGKGPVAIPITITVAAWRDDKTSKDFEG